MVVGHRQVADVRIQRHQIIPFQDGPDVVGHQERMHLMHTGGEARLVLLQIT